MIFNKLSKLFILLTFLTFVNISAKAYVADTTTIRLSGISAEIWKQQTDSAKLAKNSFFFEELKTVLQNQKSNLVLDSIYGITIAFSSDKKIRSYTWNVPLSNSKSNYYGFILNNNNIITLVSENYNEKISETKTYNQNDWYGALYYKIIKTKHKKHTQYLFLGWNAGDESSNVKLIEPFEIDGQNIFFGKSYIYDSNKKNILNRKIFSYNKRANMVLRYEDRKFRAKTSEGNVIKPSSMIVFDHLESIADRNYPFRNEGKFLVPSGNTYDGYVFLKDKWHFVESVEVKNPKLPKKQKPKPELE